MHSMINVKAILNDHVNPFHFHRVCQVIVPTKQLVCFSSLYSSSVKVFCSVSIQEELKSHWDFATYSFLLKNCHGPKALVNGMCIHDHIVRDGLEHYVPLNNLILQMYGKCDALQMAGNLFDQMCERDTSSWNFIIRANTRHGQLKDAFLLLSRMQEEGLPPTKNVICSLLSAYTGEIDICKVLSVHVIIENSDCQDDVFVGTALITMYSKCGLVEEAEKMFAHMLERDDVAWNTLIAVYHEHGHTQNAWKLYDRMLEEATMPTNVTFVNTLNSCHTKDIIIKCCQIHVHIFNGDSKFDTVVGTALMNMYSKCGISDFVTRIFDSINQKDRVSWNAIIAAHLQNSESRNALTLFHKMCQEGVLSDKCTFASTLSACANERSIQEGKRIHVLLLACGFGSDTMLGNALVNIYGKCASLEDSCKVFNEMPCRDIISSNTIISVFAQNGKGDCALQIFRQAQQEGLLPNDITIVTMLEIYGSEMAAEAQGYCIHASLFGSEFLKCTTVGNALISFYAKYNRLEDARNVLNELPKKDETTFIHFLSACAIKALLKEGQGIHALVINHGLEYNLALGTAFITMYGKCGKLDDAWWLFQNLPEQDVIAWTAMISAYATSGQTEAALDLFEEMMQKGFKCDKITVVNILDACASQTALIEGRLMQRHVMIASFESDIVVGTSLLNMYGKCGILEDARKVFDSLAQRDTIAWTVMIATYAQHGYAKEALKLFQKMKEADVSPNEITFISVLNACSHSGLVDEGRQYFRSMNAIYGIAPEVDHYNCIIDLLARAGLMEEAEALVSEMPVSPCSASWTTLLGACRDKSSSSRGEQMAENAFEIDPDNASPYIALSNIYSGAEG